MSEKAKRGRPSKDVDNSKYSIVRDEKMEPYYIQIDSTNFTVFEQVTPTKGFAGQDAKGKMLDRPLGYYTSFRNALKRVAKEKFYTNEGEYNSIKEYMNSWDEVKNGLDNLLNSIEI